MTNVRTLVRPLACAIASAFIVMVPALTHAQALTSISSLRVGYSTRKVTAKPTGELKAQLDSIDKDMAVASRLGQNAEVRRLLAHGTTLLAGRPWNDAADYNSSLLLRTDNQVVESKRPYAVRLEQLYSPNITLTRSLSAHATLVGVAPGAQTQTRTLIKDFGITEGVSRDLRESPQQFEFDVHDVADGRYILSMQVLDSTRAIGVATLPIVIHKGLDETVARLETAAATVPVDLRAEILYPIDRMHNVNRGKLELRTFDADSDFARAEAIVAAVKARKDPFAGRTGDFKRHYALDAANEVMPYHMYVPTNYKANKSAPLIIALHGLGGTEDAFFDGYGKVLPKLAEQNGYIIAAPLGYRVDGGYGWTGLSNMSDVAARHSSEWSEMDVMQVLERVRKLYNVDPNRIYLMGHSLGAIGTWYLAPKYADIWAAVAAFSGQGNIADAAKMQRIPNFVVHGDADATVNVRGSRTMVEAMKALNMDVTYVEVPGGSHSGVVEPNLAGAIQFFNAHKKGVVN
ncbi:MAG: PHB depolymerase family esterase [Gemmatimonadaceae bacterium]